jgi:nitrate reductase cytochrome c-type subunit
MKKLALLLITASIFSACTSTSEKKGTDQSEAKQDSLDLEKQQENEEKIQKYSDIGFKYASTTKATLGKNLMGAIMEKGTAHALDFCNVQAMPLTDSMSQLHNAIIKRVSDKPRNQNNLANTQELEQIEYYKRLIAEGKTGKDIQPNVQINGDQVQFYYPILTNEMCLQCHGVKNKNVKPATLKMLSELYPEDKATGYQDKEVRGIWSIIFEK